MAADTTKDSAPLVAFVFPVIIISFTLLVFILVRLKILTTDKLGSFLDACDLIFRVILGDLASSRIRKERASEIDGIMLHERLRVIDNFSAVSSRGSNGHKSIIHGHNGDRDSDSNGTTSNPIHHQQ